ncbi:hypothetical protein V8B97DRAFT_1955135 [Scleroderma yunnanense]
MALLILGALLVTVACAQQAVWLQSTNTDIIYNPPVCSPSAPGCASPWQIINDTGLTVVSTQGPIPLAGDVVPQMFLTFRAFGLYLRTSPQSNATVNFTLTAEPSDTSVTNTVNTSLNVITVIDLPITQTTTLGITFIPGDLPSRFDVESVTLVVANASTTSSYLPSPSLPPSSFAPIYTPPATSSQTHSKKLTIIGATLGSVLGVFLILVIVLAIVLYRKRRQVAKDGVSEMSLW